MSRKNWRKGIGLLLTGVLCSLSNVPVRAELVGSGTEDSPYYGTAAPGDRFRPEVYVKNLSTTDQTEIVLERSYEAKQYRAEADAGNGHFSDGSTTKRISVRYGEKLIEVLERQLGENPVQEGRFFSGWYLPGNHRLAETMENGVMRAGASVNSVLHAQTPYLIANDVSADLQNTDRGSSGLPQIHAIWRNNTAFAPDGNEAQRTVPAGSQPADLWDCRNQNTGILEKCFGLEDADAYSVLHGMTRYQYGRVRLNAKTDYAVNYQWYRKKAGSEETELLQEGERSYRLTLKDLKRTDDQTEVFCVVTIGAGTETESEEERKERQLTYETKLRVFYLPEILRTDVTADGKSI